MKILVTGLCLQGNKGGPALALSLMKVIEERWPAPVEFIFSVPSNGELPRERRWAQIFGVGILEEIAPADIVKPRRLKAWLSEILRADFIVDMSGISYVSPPRGNLPHALLGHRFRYAVLSRIFEKTFLAWTQSYGPLTHPLVRALARIDLKRQPIVFCRGNDCLGDVQNLLPGKRAMSFPDVATILPFDPSDGRRLIESKMGMTDLESLVTVSPSSMIHSLTKDWGEASHTARMTRLCRYLGSRGYRILFVPHTFRPERGEPDICDDAVARLIMNGLEPRANAIRLSEDLSPVDLKSVISASSFHIGARYHSLVAALSSGVPCLSVAWHPKYRDLMSMYGMESFIDDGFNRAGGEKEATALLDRIISERSGLKSMIAGRQSSVATEIERNAGIFVQLLKDALP